MATYQEIIDLGVEKNLPPQDIMGGLTKFRSDVATQIEASPASDEAKFVTGSELVIDGGYTAR